MRKIIGLIMVVLTSLAATAQYNDRDLHFYDEEFDWHWDVRVRISDGIRSGLLTNWEADRLYRRLERVEEKEFRYMADGNYTLWEQDDIWSDVRWLNRRIGNELFDFDRRFYGFNGVFLSFNNYPFWYNRFYNNGFNFYRYDALGFGNFGLGYNACYFVPRNQVIVRNNTVVINTNVYNRQEARSRAIANNNVRRDRTTVSGNTRASGSVGNTNARTSRSTSGNAPSSRDARIGSSRDYSNERSRSLESSRSSRNSSGTISRPSTSSRERSLGSSSGSRTSSYERPSSRSSREVNRATAPSRNSSVRTSTPSSRSSSSVSRSSSSRSSSSVSKPSSSRSSSGSRSSSVSRSSSSRSSSPARSSSSSSSRSSRSPR